MNKLKKVLPFLAISLIGMNSVVSAVDDMQVRNLENRVSALEQRRGANGMINPPARPIVKDGIDLWIQAEALYMRATEDGLHYGIKQNSDVSYVDGRVKNVSYDWTWGWRAGIGYNLPHDGWDMLLNYSWFRSNETDSTNPGVAESLDQTRTDPNNAAIANAVVKRGSERTHLKFDHLDFQMGREFFVSKWLTLRPFVGARGLWAHRHLKVKYKDGELGSGLLANTQKLHEKFNNRLRGGGLLAGLNTQWGLGTGWSVFGDFGLALIYGNQHLHSKEDAISPSGSPTRFAHVHDKWTSVRTTIDLALGLRWDQFFNDDTYRARLQLGWEQHLLPNFGKDLNFVSSANKAKFVYNQGDLAISGLTLQARFDF